MADKTSLASYNKSGFGKSSGIADLQEQVQKLSTDEASLRQQAEARYQPTYEAEKASLNTQLTALIKSQTDDSDLLNKQYEQSVNTMMDKLSKRGLHTGTMPETTTAALDKFRNDVMAQRQAVYNTQQQSIRNVQDTLENNYELNVQARMTDIKQGNLASLSSLLTQIAKLQTSSYNDYINYLLAKKKKSGGGGGGGGYRRRGGGGGALPEVPQQNNSLPANYFGGSTKPAASAPKKKAIVTRGSTTSGIKLAYD